MKPDETEVPMLDESALASATPIGLAAAAKLVGATGEGAALEVAPAAAPAPAINCNALARGSIKMLTSWGESKSPVWKTSTEEVDALGDMWGPVISHWLGTAPTVFQVALIGTGLYVAPRVAQLMVERRKAPARPASEREDEHSAARVTTP